MPLPKPPSLYDGNPNRYLLRRGTCLWRVHRHRYPAQAFNSTRVDPLFGGARFDATDADPYSYYYAALDENTALAETLLREPHRDEWGYHAVPRREVARRQISGLTLTRDLDLVSLISGEDLAAVAQDASLVTATGPEYAQTRGSGHWLRGQAKWAHGFIWESQRNRSGLAIVLFGDRCAQDFGSGYEQVLLHEVTELAIDLDDEAGANWLNEQLRRYRVTVPPPRRRVPGFPA
jgi:hypothetical protein